MTTPDFEEWLTRQDFEITDEVTQDKFIQMLIDQYDLHDGTLDVARDWYATKFQYGEELGIHAFTLIRVFEGVKYKETRYGIEGYRGSWGAERMYEIAEEKAEAKGMYEAAEWYRAKQKEK